jgi:hypothetical protein
MFVALLNVFDVGMTFLNECDARVAFLTDFDASKSFLKKFDLTQAFLNVFDARLHILITLHRESELPQYTAPVHCPSTLHQCTAPVLYTNEFAAIICFLNVCSFTECV